MKNAIIQYYIDPFLYDLPKFNKLKTHHALADLSKKSWEDYAKKHSCDFIRVSKPKLKYKHPTYERFDLFLDDSWWKKYDQIMYVDSDVFAMPYARNIFEQYPNLNAFKFCWYKKMRTNSAEDIRKEYQKTLLSACDPKELKEKGFQPGVFIVTKHSAKKMRDWIKLYQKLDHDDGQILVWATIKSGVETTDMDESYNYKRAYFKRAPRIDFFHD